MKKLVTGFVQNVVKITIEIWPNLGIFFAIDVIIIPNMLNNSSLF